MNRCLVVESECLVFGIQVSTRLCQNRSFAQVVVTLMETKVSGSEIFLIVPVANSNQVTTHVPPSDK